MQYVGIDVHTKASQLCQIDDNGEITERRIPTERTLLQDLFRDAPRSKVLLEATTEGEWVARCIEELGLRFYASLMEPYSNIRSVLKCERIFVQDLLLCEGRDAGLITPPRVRALLSRLTGKPAEG